MKLFRFHILLVFLFLGICFLGKVRAASFAPALHHHTFHLSYDTGKQQLQKDADHHAPCAYDSGNEDGAEDDTLSFSGDGHPGTLPVALLYFYQSLLPEATALHIPGGDTAPSPELSRQVPYYILFHTILIPFQFS